MPAYIKIGDIKGESTDRGPADSFQFKSGSAKDPLPTEEITLNYEEIKWTYSKPGGDKGYTEVEWTYDGGPEGGQGYTEVEWTY